MNNSTATIRTIVGVIQTIRIFNRLHNDPKLLDRTLKEMIEAYEKGDTDTADQA